jgi:hypothetical protein
MGRRGITADEHRCKQMGGRDKKIKKLLSEFICVYLWLKKYSRRWTQMHADG